MVHHQAEEKPPARTESVLLAEIRHKNTQWRTRIVRSLDSLQVCDGSEFGWGTFPKWLCGHTRRHITHNWNRVIGRHCCWNCCDISSLVLQYEAFEDNVQSRQDREVHGAKTVCGPDRGLLYCLLLCVDCLFPKAKSIE